jgi:hypothetical protein
MERINMHEITIQERLEYGMKRIYPTNKLGRDYAERLNKKTLSHGDLSFMSTLGVSIRQEAIGGDFHYQLTNEANFNCESCG